MGSLRDYTHASKVFRSFGYELKPKFKFLYHVVFNINVQEIPGLRSVLNATSVGELS